MAISLYLLLLFNLNSFFGFNPPRVTAVIATIKVLHLDGVVFINNNARVVFWARTTSRVKARNITSSRQRWVESDELVHMLLVQQIVFGVQCFADFYCLIRCCWFGVLVAMLAKFHELIILRTNKVHVMAGIAELHGNITNERAPSLIGRDHFLSPFKTYKHFGL
jgi:hypothetical protein